MKNFPEVGDVISFTGCHTDRFVVVEIGYTNREEFDVSKRAVIQQLSPEGKFLPHSPANDIVIVHYCDQDNNPLTDEERSLMTPEEISERDSFVTQDGEDRKRRMAEGETIGDKDLDKLIYCGHMQRVFVW